MQLNAMQLNTVQVNTASSSQSLEKRIAHLESVLKPSNNTLTLQVGTSKVVISSDKIELVCQGAIHIKAIKMNLESQTDIEIRANANISEKAGSNLLVASGNILTLKGATINQS